MICNWKTLGMLLLSLTAGGIIAASQVRPVQKNDPDLQDLLYLPKVPMQMKLYSAAQDPKTGKSVSGMTLGFDYKEAGKNIRSHNSYENGETEEIFYRSDETREWSRDYYPLAPGESLPVLRSVARFEADGKTYTSHDVMRRNGTRERRGRLLADGKYEQTYFCEDGKTPRIVQLYTNNKSFLSETAIFCHNGKPIREVGSENGDRTLVMYNQDGSIKHRIRAVDGGEAGVFYRGDVYDKNGKVTVNFDAGYMSEQVKTYRDGKLDKEWQDYFYSSRTRELTVYDPNNPKRKLFTQSWKLREDYKPASGYVLVKITEYDSKNKVKREVEIDPKTGKPVKDQAVNPAYTVKYERPQIPEFDDGNTATKEKVYDYR